MSRFTHLFRAAVRLQTLEDRLAPAYPIPNSAILASPDDGGIPIVKVINPATGLDVVDIQAYENAFRGGVHAALGDVTGDGVNDIILGPGQGGGPRIRIIDGKNGNTLADFFVYESTFTGGVYIATGDVNGDGKADIITGTGNGGGPRVRVLDGATLGSTVLQDYFAYEDTFRGGVQVASGDINGDGTDDVITGTGIGGGPRVIAFSGKDKSVLANYFAYDSSFRNGVQVSSGDLNSDGRDDIITGAGPGGGPHVRAMSGKDQSELSSFFSDDSAFRGGVRVSNSDVNNDGFDDYLCEMRIGNESVIRVFDGATGKYRESFSRVIDDNPSPNDLFERPVGGTTPPATGIPSYIEGKITEVNAASNFVKIQLSNGTVVTVTAGPSTAVERNGVHTTLANLIVGEKGEALIGVDGIAWEIEGKTLLPGGGGSGGGSGSGQNPSANSKVEGTITAVNVAGSVVSIRTQNGTVFLVTINAATNVERNNVSSTLSAFKVGDIGEALIGFDGFATKVEAVGT